MIASAGFASGDRVVVGHWRRSPVGPVTDVMWARPDGERVLLAPHEEAAAFITAVYRFDRVVVGPVVVTSTDRSLDVRGSTLELRVVAGRGVPLPGPRPAWVTRWLERPLARGVLGVRTYGVSPTGVREWYRADRWRPLLAAEARVDGRDLGAVGPVAPPLGVGFSEPPRRPSWVEVRPLLHDPSGRLDAVLATATGCVGRVRPMATATPSPTPNPDAVKYTLDVPVPETVNATSPEAASSSPLAAAIFAGGGVASVFATADFVTVTRQPGADWDDITATVQAAVAEHL